MKQKVPMSFKFFDGYAQAVDELDELIETLGIAPCDVEQAKKDFTYDIVQYGCWLIDPDFTKYDIALRTAIRMAFGVMRKSIDKSHASAASGHIGGKQGGRGNKKGVTRKKKKTVTDEVPESTFDYMDADKAESGWGSVCIADDIGAIG